MYLAHQDEVEVTDLVQMGDSLWIATAKHGLWNLNIKGKEEWVQYLNPEVYRSNFLHKLVVHKEKNQLWLNTAYGFASFDLTSHGMSIILWMMESVSLVRNGSIFAMLDDGAIISGANRYFQYLLSRLPCKGCSFTSTISERGFYQWNKDFGK